VSKDFLEPCTNDSRRKTRWVLPISVVALFTSFFSYMLLPLIMDEQYWFLEYPGGMDYRFQNLNTFVWGEGDDNPGRYSPIKRYVVYAYTLFGIRIADSFNMDIQAFRSVVFAVLLVLVFSSLAYFLRSVRISHHKENMRLTFAFTLHVTLMAALIFGLFGNMRWQLNGLIVYPILTYPPVIVGLLLMGASMRNIRALSGDVSSKKHWLVLAVLAIITSAWSNWFYELSMATIVLVLGAIGRELFNARSKGVQRITLMGMAIYVLSFLLIFIPTRLTTTRQLSECEPDCYEGLVINIGTIPKTFILNMINPMPMVGVSQDFANPEFSLWLTRFLSAVFLFSVILIVIAIFANLRAASALLGNNSSSRASILKSFTPIFLLLLLMAVTSSLIMSLSVRAAKLVELGTPYRQTPSVWLAYAVIISIFLVISLRNARRIQYLVASFMVVAGYFQISSNFFNVDQIVNNQRTLFVNELYPLLLREGDPAYTSLARCALLNSIESNSPTAEKFFPLINDYSLWKTGSKFCDHSNK
jgi:hypothetical protein